MKTFKHVSWFRLFVVVGLSIATSLSMFFGDEVLSKGEIFNTILQAAIVGFSFLQCPEQTQPARKMSDAGSKNS
jgi:hypothetical protein